MDRTNITLDVFEIQHYAQSISMDPEFLKVVAVVTDNPKFGIWWGGLCGQHHDFDGGLARHTREVIELCFDSAKRLKLKIDKKETFLSALFHDIGKTYDYIPNPNYGDRGNSEPKYIAAEHKRLIHHISRSGLIWSHAVTTTKLNDFYHDKVLHNILAHHGERAYGSPVFPKGQVAWLLHLCDSISARMNDCNRLDLVHGKPKKSMLRTFKYHYNKPESRRLRKPKMSVHFNKECHIVDHIECLVPAKTYHMKRQPYCVMKGKCMNVDIEIGKNGLLTAVIL